MMQSVITTVKWRETFFLDSEGSGRGSESGNGSGSVSVSGNGTGTGTGPGSRSGSRSESGSGSNRMNITVDSLVPMMKSGITYVSESPDKKGRAIIYFKVARNAQVGIRYSFVCVMLPNALTLFR
jgi:hypothetical protein